MTADDQIPEISQESIVRFKRLWRAAAIETDQSLLAPGAGPIQLMDFWVTENRMRAEREASDRLTHATWALAAATIGLVLATIALVVVTVVHT